MAASGTSKYALSLAVVTEWPPSGLSECTHIAVAGHHLMPVSDAIVVCHVSEITSKQVSK